MTTQRVGFSSRKSGQREDETIGLCVMSLMSAEQGVTQAFGARGLGLVTWALRNDSEPDDLSHLRADCHTNSASERAEQKGFARNSVGTREWARYRNDTFGLLGKQCHYIVYSYCKAHGKETHFRSDYGLYGLWHNRGSTVIQFFPGNPEIGRRLMSL